MYHPTTRVLTVLELLQSRPQLSATELAARLEVDARTIRRYITMLQDMGIPVEAEMGRLGGYSLRPGFKLPPLMFSDGEALALLLGLLAVRQLGIDSAACSVEGALAKLERVLPEPLHDLAAAAQTALTFDLFAAVTPVDMDILSTAARAAHLHRSITIGYRKGEAGSAAGERVVDPYAVVCHRATWYVIGFCHQRQDRRVFRLDRVTHAEMNAAAFSPPAAFDALDYLLDSFARMPDLWEVEVLLNLPLPEAERKLSRGFGVLEAEPPGVRLTTAVTDLDQMARVLVSLACPFTVIRPPELRAALRALATEIVDQIGSVDFA